MPNKQRKAAKAASKAVKAAKNPQGELYKMRHSCEHVLHQAIFRLYGQNNLKAAMGPATDEGFYFDADLKKIKISEADFPKIEAEMAKIVKENMPICKKILTLAEARKLFKDNPYKQEWLDGIKAKRQKPTVYWTGKEFVDLCAGPHVKSTGKIGAFKLLSIAGAYWHGSEKNKMLTRIYGTCFPTQKELEAYLLQQQEAEKRDHRKIGKELDFFSTNGLTGPGLILWHPKLAIIRKIVEDFWREEHIKRNYQLVFTPHIASMDMFVKTRHYTKYINSMFPAMLHQNIEGDSRTEYTADEQLKPMNCPNHVQVFKTRPRSYRELPFRMGELGTVYRYERAGVLHGMTRVRGFTQDDSHIFCTPDQVISEVRDIIKLTRFFYEDIFGFKDYQAYLSTRPEKYLGTLKMWDFAQKSLAKAMELEGINFKIDEGQGVFYGPKIDSKVKDSLGREWQLGTIQFDFNLPTYSESSAQDIEDFWAMKTFREKFKTKEKLAKYIKSMGRGLDVTYIDKDGKTKPVMMVHRVILGSLERFFGILIEHYAGAFPIWLSPIQVKVIPITDKHIEYADWVKNELIKQNIRIEVDSRQETTSAKIRDGELQKIPYLLVVGDREAQAKNISVRQRGKGNLGTADLADFITKIKKEIEEKTIN
ncbi:MAG: threonine--tRNA ligase [bacterium]|nr:threonine--tRNA ligase [bacterium]